jgi:drug/metabolite transporter (DMT)-like permease
VAAGRLGATRASATVFLIPVVALGLGVALRGEHVAPLSVVGAAVCLAGAWLIRPRPTPQPAGPAVAPVRLEPACE